MVSTKNTDRWTDADAYGHGHGHGHGYSYSYSYADYYGDRDSHSHSYGNYYAERYSYRYPKADANAAISADAQTASYAAPPAVTVTDGPT